MTTDLQDGVMGTTPATRDERDIYDEWMLSENLDSSPVSWDGLITWGAWEKRASLAESELAEVREQLRIREDERAEQWRLRRDAEGDLITSQAVVAEMRAELERLKATMVPSCSACTAVQENEQNPHTECDECGWAGLRNGRPIGAGEGEAG